ncbi:DNA topoisomerase 1 [Brevipalpus obovatus]|uniref:DNA topoisomerase 1 n=1 Tax=Brevipalpus obovatus TaxID=246614 RepID=UPI003D9E0A77
MSSKKKLKNDQNGKPLKKVKLEKIEVNEKSPSPKKRVKKEQEEEPIWKWWLELGQGERDNTTKWTYLEHKGPVFAPEYEPLPPNVKFYYDKKPVKLSLPAEEVATFYAKMLDHDYTSKEKFNENFFHDWRKTMTKEERELIKNLDNCNFTDMHKHFKELSEQRKNMTKEEKLAKKEKEEALVKEYGYCVLDKHKQKIANFRIEPPGLFRGRGEHPKMGKHKKRINPEDVIINCSKNAPIPPPPPGHKWKEVRHDNTVSWLASWTENIMGNVKYVMLNPSSKLKSEKDFEKYEKAHELSKYVDKIRADYTIDFKAREMVKRQRAVALYFIDKLALRAGNEKDDSEAADTVGCCSLRIEHITLQEQDDEGRKYVVEFDFLGKDSIRYQNAVPVEKKVFKNLKLFMEGKSSDDDLFDRLNTTTLNKYLNSLMPGLTAKVFRTYNASITLQRQLKELSKKDMSQAELLLAYNRANRQVALLCNHQRAVPKTFDKSKENLQNKISDKKKQIKEVKKELKGDKKNDKLKKKKSTLEEQLKKLEISLEDKEEGKNIALGTSKLNYLDPRISVAWCKKFNIPIEKIYNKTQREKFRWAIEMTDADFEW